MRITLLGAGHIGQTIARLLGSCGDYQVTVVDRSEAALARLAGDPAKTLLADTASPEALLRVLRGQDAVALPPGHLLPAGQPPPADLGLHFPLAAKLQSAALLHKSEAGAVLLRIGSAADLAAALQRLAAIGRERGIEVQGVLVEEMVGFDHELLLGLRRDPQFGAVLTLGRGGVEVELDPDAATRLLPLDAAQVEAMLRSLRSARLFDGFRGRPGVDLPAIAARIAALCRWFEGQDDLLELEINPLALRGDRAWALDALVRQVDGHG